MNKKGQSDFEEIFKAVIGIIFLIVFIGALAPLIGALNVLNFSSWFIGFTVIMVVLAFILKILDELGVFS